MFTKRRVLRSELNLNRKLRIYSFILKTAGFKKIYISAAEM